MNNRKFNNLLAYFSVFAILICVVLGYLSTKVFSWPTNVSNFITNLAFYIACLMTIFSAFVYASSKRNTMYMFVLVLVVVAIVLFLFVL